MIQLPTFWGALNIALLMLYTYLYIRDIYQDFRVKRVRLIFLLWLWLWSISLSFTFKSFNVPENSPLRTYFYFGLMALCLSALLRANLKLRNDWVISRKKDQYIKIKAGLSASIGIYAIRSYPLEIGDNLRFQCPDPEGESFEELLCVAEWVYEFNSKEEAEKSAKFKDFSLTKEEIKEMTSDFVNLGSEDLQKNCFRIVRFRRVQ